jgi:hypothetical protein
LPPLAGPSPPLLPRSTLAIPTCPRGRRARERCGPVGTREAPRVQRATRLGTAGCRVCEPPRGDIDCRPSLALRHPCCPIYPRHPCLPKGDEGARERCSTNVSVETRDAHDLDRSTRRRHEVHVAHRIGQLSERLWWAHARLPSFPNRPPSRRRNPNAHKLDRLTASRRHLPLCCYKPTIDIG